MSNKTDMQQLIDWLEKIEYSGLRPKLNAQQIIAKATELRDTVEREQIIDAHNDGQITVDGFAETGIAETYYTTTYPQQSKSINK